MPQQRSDAWQRGIVPRSPLHFALLHRPPRRPAETGERRDGAARRARCDARPAGSLLQRAARRRLVPAHTASTPAPASVPSSFAVAGIAAAQDVQVQSWWPENPTKSFFPGKQASLVLGVKNTGTAALNVTYAAANLASPYNASMTMFNFTGVVRRRAGRGAVPRAGGVPAEDRQCSCPLVQAGTLAWRPAFGCLPFFSGSAVPRTRCAVHARTATVTAGRGTLLVRCIRPHFEC